MSAGGCNACEADLNVLGTVVFDLGRFGIQFVASPRHADGLVVTGAGQREHESGAAGDLRGDSRPQARDRRRRVRHQRRAVSWTIRRSTTAAGRLLPVDLYIPGCPPHPLTILDGLLRLLGRLEEGRATSEGGSREPTQ